jgi:hypothetical protein
VENDRGGPHRPDGGDRADRPVGGAGDEVVEGSFDSPVDGPVDGAAEGSADGSVDDDTGGGATLLGGFERMDGLLGEGIGARLERWAADARVEAAARRRARERWLRQQAEEEATFAGVLIDLGEHGVEVALHTRTGRVHRGRVGVVGADFVGLLASVGSPGLGGGAGEEVLVALDSVTSVRMQAGARLVTGDRVLTSRLSLAEVIIALAAERERVVLVLADGGETVAGVLQSVGQDMVVVRLADGPPAARPPTAYVALATIVEVVV